jgi:hypothetical protein
VASRLVHHGQDPEPRDCHDGWPDMLQDVPTPRQRRAGPYTPAPPKTPGQQGASPKPQFTKPPSPDIPLPPGALPAGTPAPMPMPPQSLEPRREPLCPGEVDRRMLPGENGRPSPFMERPKMPSMNQPPSSKPDGARNPLSRAFPAAWSPIEVPGGET